MARFHSGCALALVAALVFPAVLNAQARAGDDVNAAAPLAATYERIGDAISRQVIGADDAASHWLSAHLSSLEPVAQVRDFALAAAREPKEMLFVASLADACMRMYSPVPSECAERDAVGYWSSRDSDNAVPWLLQAERARRRNNVSALIDNLERASSAARYDDYSGRAGALVANIAKAPPNDRAAVVLYANRQSTALPGPLAALENVCAAQTRALDERIARHCIRLGALMAERAASFTNRRAGTQTALASAATDSARAATTEAARATIAEQDRCRESLVSLERAAQGSAAERDRAATVGLRFLADRAKAGEAMACDALDKAIVKR